MEAYASVNRYFKNELDATFPIEGKAPERCSMDESRKPMLSMAQPGLSVEAINKKTMPPATFTQPHISTALPKVRMFP